MQSLEKLAQESALAAPAAVLAASMMPAALSTGLVSRRRPDGAITACPAMYELSASISRSSSTAVEEDAAALGALLYLKSRCARRSAGRPDTSGRQGSLPRHTTSLSCSRRWSAPTIDDRAPPSLAKPTHYRFGHRAPRAGRACR